MTPDPITPSDWPIVPLLALAWLIVEAARTGRWKHWARQWARARERRDLW